MLHDHKKLDSTDKTSKIPSNDWIVQRKAWLLQHLDSQIRFMPGFYWLVAKYSNHGLCRKVACRGPCFPRLRLSRYQAYIEIVRWLFTPTQLGEGDLMFDSWEHQSSVDVEDDAAPGSILARDHDPSGF